MQSFWLHKQHKTMLVRHNEHRSKDKNDTSATPSITVVEVRSPFTACIVSDRITSSYYVMDKFTIEGTLVDSLYPLDLMSHYS